jgi:hypothetical protein
MKLRWLLPLLLFIVACGVEEGTQPDLPPLPTTGLPMISLAPVEIPEPDTTAYFTFIFERIEVPPTVTWDTLLGFSVTWCDFLERGMGRMNLESWIAEIASEQGEYELWMVSAEASARHICPQQYYKWNP